jgi:pyruvate/2-oxoglutarate dehydrogenase complex dihydrolipoamide dehydrogenase (E3) component
MVIVGAGVTGIEFAQAFQRLGVNVTVLVHSARILRTLDSQGSAALSAILKKEGIRILTDANITKAVRNDQNKINLVIQQQNEILNLETEVVFVATGRLPNIENLGLEQIGIQCTKQGIIVDDYFRTNLKHIYAIGDVIAWPHRFAHMAEYGSEVVYKHLYLKNFAPKAKLKWVPGVIFTNPEMASLGVTEQEAKAQKLAYETLFWEFKDLDRAAIQNKPEGFIKLLLVKQRLIGATVVGERAGELLGELGLLMQKNLSISDIVETIHAYPTWAEGLRRAIQVHLEKPALKTHFLLKRLLQRTLSRL